MEVTNPLPGSKDTRFPMVTLQGALRPRCLGSEKVEAVSFAFLSRKDMHKTGIFDWNFHDRKG